DNETSWFDWTLLATRADVRRFVTLLNAHRVLRDVEHERQRVALNELIRRANISWHGVRLDHPDWSHSSHSIAFTAKFSKLRAAYHIIVNAYWEALGFELPTGTDGIEHSWHRWIDTFLDSPDDIAEGARAPAVPSRTYNAGPRSVVVLSAGFNPEGGQPPRAADLQHAART